MRTVGYTLLCVGVGLGVVYGAAWTDWWSLVLGLTRLMFLPLMLLVPMLAMTIGVLFLLGRRWSMVFAVGMGLMAFLALARPVAESACSARFGRECRTAEEIAGAAEQYREDTGRYPASLAELGDAGQKADALVFADRYDGFYRVSEDARRFHLRMIHPVGTGGSEAQVWTYASEKQEWFVDVDAGDAPVILKE